MVRITTRGVDGELVITIEGSLHGPWVDEVRDSWREATKSVPADRIKVDLRGICRVDEAGRQLMTEIYHEGARFITAGCVMPEIVREISESAVHSLVRRS